MRHGKMMASVAAAARWLVRASFKQKTATREPFCDRAIFKKQPPAGRPVPPPSR